MTIKPYSPEIQVHSQNLTKKLDSITRLRVKALLHETDPFTEADFAELHDTLLAVGVAVTLLGPAVESFNARGLEWYENQL